MSPVEGPAGRSGAPAGETDVAPEQGTNAPDATTLLVAVVDGCDRPRAMALSPEAILRLIAGSRGGFVTIAPARDLEEATAAVHAMRTAPASRHAVPVAMRCDCHCTSPAPAPWTNQVHTGDTVPTPYPPMDQE